MKPKTSMFDILSSKMTPSERRELLAKFKESDNKLENNKIIDLYISQEKISFKDIYDKMNFFQKIIIFIRQFLYKLPFEKTIEDFAFNQLKRSLSSATKPVIDSSGKNAGTFLLKCLQDLDEKLNYIRWGINCVNFYGKGSFYAFLNSSIFPEISVKFEDELDVDKFLTKNKIADESTIRKDINLVYDEFFATYPENNKKTMYKIAQDLYKLERLANFPMETFIKKLKNSSILSTGNEFVSLTSILYLFTLQSNDILLKCIFLYGQNVDEESKIDYPFWVDKTKLFLNSLSFFIKNVDLRKLTSYLIQKVDYMPVPEVGGEDWFSNLKIYWRNYKEKKIEKCVRVLKTEKHIEALKDIFKISHYDQLINYNPEKWIKYQIPIFFSSSLAFINYFIVNFIPTFNNNVVEPLIKEGQFYNQKNKEELLLAIKKILEFKSVINDAEYIFNEDGFYWETLQTYKTSTESSSSKLENFIRTITDDQLKFSRSIDFFISDLNLLTKIFYGILYGEYGRNFDTISNLKKFKNVDNNHFMSDLKNGYEKIAGFEFLLNDIYGLEKNDFSQKR